ncbi:MAG: hemolysin-type calcium-binding protein, partial [Trichodesmium sp. St2_bin2_1]|nr:hemolysin-type calcium-binding protein [Trichodesmium sp. St2_bin2_1]
SDRFLFDIGSQFNLADMGSDIITDFNSAELDKIVLSKTTFTSLDSVVGDGFTVTEEFAVVDNGAAVATSTAKIVYNSANGQIFYNPNGITSGFGDGGLFATLENQANLQTEDFVLTGL